MSFAAKRSFSIGLVLQTDRITRFLLQEVPVGKPSLCPKSYRNYTNWNRAETLGRWMAEYYVALLSDSTDLRLADYRQS